MKASSDRELEIKTLRTNLEKLMGQLCKLRDSRASLKAD